MKFITPDHPNFDRQKRQGPQIARRSVGGIGIERLLDVAYGVKDPDAPGGERWHWTQREDRPVEGTPVAPFPQEATFSGANYELLHRVALLQQQSPGRVPEDSLKEVLATIELSLLHPSAINSQPIWNLGLGLRLAHLSPEALEVMHRLSEEAGENLEQLVTVAEGVVQRHS